MRLGNKVLTIILGLLLLNLIREYRPSNPKNPSIKTTPFEFNIVRRDWSYYSSVFNGKNEPIKISLPLTLHGTIISDPQRSFAVIEDRGIQGLYGLGDIVSGARIVAMSRNRVVLDYKGTKQELMADAMAEAEPRPYLAYLETGHFQGQTLDFAKLMAQLRIKPYFEGGRCVGFQISNINGSIKQMGLQEGDIVESINGVKISDPLKALEILYKSNPVHLSIDRQDEKVELDCKVEG